MPTYVNDGLHIAPSDRVIKIKTPGNHNLYFKFKDGTKSLSDIKDYLFSEYKYVCDNISDPDMYGFKLNNQKIPDFVSEQRTDISTDDIERKKMFNRQIFDIVTKHHGNLSLFIDFEKITKDKYDNANTHYESIKHHFEDGINISIVPMCGKKILIKCQHEIVTVGDLKVYIYIRDKIPPDQMRLIFNSHILNDDDLLSSCGVIEDSTIHLILKLRGGMFSEVSGRNGSYEPLKDVFIDLDT